MTTTTSGRWPVNIRWDFAEDGAPDEVEVAAVERGDVLVDHDGKTALVDWIMKRKDGTGFILQTDPWGALHRSRSEYLRRVPRERMADQLRDPR